jgi:hypothetical protein
MVLVLPLLAAACVAPTQGALNQAVLDCNYGNPYACQALPALNARVQQENYNNQVAAGLGLVVVGATAIGLAASGGGHHGGWHGGGWHGRRW